MRRPISALFALLPALSACASAPSAPPLTPPAPCPVAAPPPAPPSAAPPAEPSAGDVYLSPADAGGSPFCFNPDSKTLRAEVTRDSPKEDTPLDRLALAADIRDLHVAMSKLYAGYPELLQSTTFDVERFFADWERDVRAAGAGAGGAITFGDGVLGHLVELRKHIRDNHLSVWGWGSRLSHRDDLTFSEYQARGKVEGFSAEHCTFAPLTPVPSTARFARVLTTRGLEDVSTFSAQSSVPSVNVRCGEHTTRFEKHTRHAKAKDEHAPPYETRVVAGATLVVIRTLWGSPEVTALLQRIPKDYDLHRKKPFVVFDFRGNGGGDDSPVFAWIEEAKRGTWPDPYVEVRVTGAGRACGDWNELVAEQIGFERVDSKEGKAERAAFLAKTPLGDALGAPVQVMSGTGEDTHAKSPYTGRIFALVDGASASSGESAPDGLRAALGATLVGERTGGYLEFGDIRPYAMPRTGIVWQMGSKRNYYVTPHDGVGLPVDVYLDDDLIEAPAETLVPLLEKLPKK